MSSTADGQGELTFFPLCTSNLSLQVGKQDGHDQLAVCWTAHQTHGDGSPAEGTL